MKASTISKILAFISALIAVHSPVRGADSSSFELASGNKTHIVRFGAQWEWDKQWLRFNGAHLGGYWDLTVAQWRSDRFHNVEGSTQRIIDIGLTPVFRFQRNDLQGPYVEAGIGAHYLSRHYDNNGKRLSTHFQFGDHLGIGYVFPNKLDIGLKVQHFSNGGIKEPNNGVNLAVVRVSYTF